MYRDEHFFFLPKGFVEDASSAYCAQTTSLKSWEDFRDNFSVTYPLSYGTATGGSDLLISKTAVSNYFTETSGCVAATPTTTDHNRTSSAAATPATIGHSQTRVSTGNSSATQPQSSSRHSAQPSLRQPASGSVAAAATSTGNANTLEASALLGIGVLGLVCLF